MTILAACLAMGACAEPVVTDVERVAFEKLAEIAVALPPELRTAGIGAYSTNRLAYALNNGLAMTKGGRIWASWISGGDGPGSFTAANWSDDGGDTWSDVKLVIDGHNGTVTGRTNIIGTFWLDPEGVFHCFTDQSLLHFDGRAGFWESVCENPDAEKPVWGPARRIGHGHVMNKPIVLKNGHWAMSSYLNGTWQGRGSVPGAFVDLDGERGAVCWVSGDKGKTWEKRGVAHFPGTDWQESQLVELTNGTLRVFARVYDAGKGCLMASDSMDEGRTWTRSYRLLTMDNTNARFQIQRLKSGRLIFVKHGKPAENARNWGGRVRLTAYLSDDEGETWKGGLLLDEGNGSYPDLFQGPDGVIYVSHDHGRGREAEIRLHRFTEEDVLAGKIVSSRGKLGILVMRAMDSAYNRARFRAP